MNKTHIAQPSNSSNALQHRLNSSTSNHSHAYAAHGNNIAYVTGKLMREL